MDIKEKLINFTLPSTFDYSLDEAKTKVIAIFDKEFNLLNSTITNQENWLVLTKTCMYALSGGEEADKGWINDNDVLDVIKSPNGQHLHLIKPNKQMSVGDEVLVKCDKTLKQVISANHTAEHIVQGALRHIVDKDIKQMGVSLTHNLLSVSFAHDKKLDDKQLKLIEDYANKAIKDSINVEVYYKPLEEAIKMCDIAKFQDVYSKVKGNLRVVRIKDIYTVLCAGRHVKNTSELEQFHIVRFSSKGSNTYKIEAITTNYLTNQYIDLYNKQVSEKLDEIRLLMKNNELEDKNILNKINSIELAKTWNEAISNLSLLNQINNDFSKSLESFKSKQMNDLVNEILNKDFDLSKSYILIELENQPSNILNILANRLINKYPNNGFIVLNTLKDKVSYLICKHPNANIKKPNEIIKAINSLVNGRGGGKENQCQGSCPLNQDTISKIKSTI